MQPATVAGAAENIYVDGESEDNDSDEEGSVLADDEGTILVTGRDVNMFGAALFARTRRRLLIVTHCPCAYADVLRNIESVGAAARMRAWHVPKTEMAAFLDDMVLKVVVVAGN